MRLRASYLLIGLVVCLGACESVSPDAEPAVVVEAYLEGGAAFGQIRLTRSAGTYQRYDSVSAAIRKANVQIRRLADDGVTEEVIPYAESPNQPGVYQTQAGSIVRPRATYELHATIPGTKEVVRSRTTVPGHFDILDASPDTVVYQGNRQIEVVVTRSVYPGREAILVFSAESRDPRVSALTPFYRQLIGPNEDTDEEELDDYLINQSPPLNEDDYHKEEDGTFLVKVPWLAFAFYGPNELRINAIDDNLFDFLRSQIVQQGGSTLAPGEIPNVIDHIEGGMGVFGSFTPVKVSVVVLRSSAT